MVGVMTDRELQQAIKDANDALHSLSCPPPQGPLPEREVRRREIILLRQVTAYKILNSREKGQRDLELLHTTVYERMTSFLNSYREANEKTS